MTEKRFTVNNDINFDDKIETYELNCIVDNENKTFYFIADSIQNVQLFIKQLNELNEENIDLHIQNDFLKDENQHMRKLVNENEQLRNRLKDWHQRTFKAHEYFNILEKVIDEVCDDDISNQIWKEYEKREKLVE